MWSAVFIASSSCSTTITELLRLLSFVNVFSNLELSFWCKPIDGSSSTYRTPVRPDPICDASLILWLSPPDKVDDALDKDK